MGKVSSGEVGGSQQLIHTQRHPSRSSRPIQGEQADAVRQPPGGASQLKHAADTSHSPPWFVAVARNFPWPDTSCPSC